MSLKATLNCEAFANAHPHDSHYDQSSFVGLAWRPEGESCCVGTLARVFAFTLSVLTMCLFLCLRRDLLDGQRCVLPCLLAYPCHLLTFLVRVSVYSLSTVWVATPQPSEY